MLISQQQGLRLEVWKSCHARKSKERSPEYPFLLISLSPVKQQKLHWGLINLEVHEMLYVIFYGKGASAVLRYCSSTFPKWIPWNLKGLLCGGRRMTSQNAFQPKALRCATLASLELVVFLLLFFFPPGPRIRAGWANQAKIEVHVIHSSIFTILPLSCTTSSKAKKEFKLLSR